MRELTNADRLERFMSALARAADSAAEVFLTGGATAVLLGWRGTTVDVDLKLVPESDGLLRAIPRLKEELRINVELAAPDQFLPALPGWRERSLFICRKDPLSYFHYDPYSQALAKLERAHRQDIGDAEALRATGLIENERLLELLAAIEGQLYRFPAVDPRALRRRVESFVAGPAAPSVATP
jgi:hypothetical protein